jgi:hypothetical protein
MKLKKLTTMQRLATILSTVIIIVGVLILSQTYFSYIEVKEMANSCYDNDGFPIIEKSGLRIDYFYCDID